MAPVLSRSLATSASLISLPSSITHPNNKVLNLKSVFLPRNNGLRNEFSCSGLKCKLEKRNNRISVRCEAAVAEKEATDTSGEKFEYQAEVSRLMDLIVHSLYSHKEVFLRELVSNASDALDKLRFLSVTEPSLLGDAGDLEIRIRPDPDNGTITIIDTGIGMTKEELVDCLGTIAQSGTSKFLKALKENKDVGADNGLIGQFGVGFYSAFLVAEKVVVSTKSPKSDKQHVWESEADSSSYVIKEETDPEKLLRRGTQITLYLREDDKYEFSDPVRIQGLVKNYSQFVAFPIYTWVEKSRTVEVEEEEEKKGEEVPEGEKKKTKKTKTEKYWDWELANETKPIWMRNPKEVEKDEYQEFYKKTFNEFLDPLAYAHFTTEGEVEFRSVLYIPGMGPLNNEDIMNPKTKNIRLYVKRVFISDDFDGELFPRYLSFVRGVVDSDDLPLNVSREILQESRIVRIMRKRLVRKTFDMIQDLSESENREDYKKFWENFGRFLKLGCVEDSGNHKRITPLLRFYTSKSEEELISLDEYVENMGENQKAIYYLATDSLKSAKSAPFLEKLVQKDIEVLYLIEPIDEVAIQNLQTYKEKKFVDISKEDLELGDDDEVQERETKQEYNLLCDWIKQQLGENVAKVQVSKRLSSSPCVLVSGKFGWSANMERLMKAQTLGDQSSLEFMRGRRILEINPDHPIIKDLNAACKNAPDSSDAKRAVDLLYDTALISSGFTPDSPAELGGKIYEMMAMALGGRWGRSDGDEAEDNAEEPDANVSEASEPQVIEPSEIGAFPRNEKLCNPSFGDLTNPFDLSPFFFKGYATAAAANVISSTDESDLSGSDDFQGLMEQVNNHFQKMESQFKPQEKKMVAGMGIGKYAILKRRQIKMETEAWEQAAQEYQEMLEDMCEQKLAPNLPYVKSLFLGWFEPLRDAIVAEQELCKRNLRVSHRAHFSDLPADMMAVITMHKLMGLLMTGNGGSASIRVVQAASVVGEAIEHEGRIHKFLEKTKKRKNVEDKISEVKSDAAIEEGKKLTKEQEKLRKKVTTLIKKQKVQQVRRIVKGHGDSLPWGQEEHCKVGSRLIQLMIETAYIQPPIDQIGDGPPDIRPAFVHTLKTITKDTQKSSRRYGVIECDPLVRKGLEKSARHMVIPYMPMLVPPLNWTGYDQGAHLFLPSYVMRIHGSKQQRDAVKRASRNQLEPVFKALDTLGNTKWRINKRVLVVIDRIWASGGNLAGLVDREDVPLPEEPQTEDEAETRKWTWKVRSVKKENSERHSQRCDVELKLAVARKMKDEEGFYYPHNLDFRGRAYPMHPYLNHLGSDVCRGILEFAEGRPLGKSGLRWLKIHLANLYAGGVDKLSYDGRISFTENHLDDIFDSADQPLEGRRWWLGAEDPFQCLAACINLSEALRSPSPETAISHTPVHQICWLSTGMYHDQELIPMFLFRFSFYFSKDGSCNGLQHYAALGRDKLGAAAVNLVGGEKPADVYSGIATRVLDIMKGDAEKDPAISPNSVHAKLLVNQVDRKLVKQTVMTSVYGVTYIGARDQIKRRLKERCIIADDPQLYSAACYAAKRCLKVPEGLWLGLENVQRCVPFILQSFALHSRIVFSLSFDTSHKWVCSSENLVKILLVGHVLFTYIPKNPDLDLTVWERSYFVMVIASENQPVQWTTPLGLPVVQPYRQLGRHLVMVKRQRTAFPPNFVHSLDGSHMMMTAVACKEAGLNFAGVHDSYWTHACNVDEMNRILREKFVELYEAPILENVKYL
ncbi:hypothetical protein DKX38_012815 [Salix brachista]|uniref:DNA-directed RNA polymerase n=1 Tax=Salix brachista TaxID=2182728 RepID=A0A5N5LPR0_9ROSI|nr:hypothetical protein DKX38_012815 [Salix brachista]